MSITILFVLFVALEIFESNWQKSDTFYGVIENNYKAYSKSILLYFVLNPTFIYSLFLNFYLNNFQLSGNFTFWINAIICLKFLDIGFRLHLMKKIDNNESIEDLVPLDIKMNNYFRYLNVLIYPTMFLFVFIN